MAPAAGPTTPPSALDILDVLNASRNPDGGYGYYPNKRSRIEPTAWVALSPSMDAGRALGWLVEAQGTDGWIRDDRQAPVNYAFNALALLALLTDSRSAAHAERLGQALLQVKGVAYANSPAVRQDNSLQAWSWVDNTASWVEPTAYSLLAIKRARQQGLLTSSAATVRARIEVGERLLADRTCASGGWNYGNSQVFGSNLYAHGPTTALALIALQDRPTLPIVDSGLRFLASNAAAERSGFALSLASLCFRLFQRPTTALVSSVQEQLPVSAAIANTVTLAGLSIVLSDDDGALQPFALGSSEASPREATR